MCVSINGPGDPDLNTGMQFASKVENLPSKFEHGRPLGSRIIRYVRNGWTDGRTKATLTGGGTIITFFYSVDDAVMCALRFTETQ